MLSLALAGIWLAALIATPRRPLQVTGVSIIIQTGGGLYWLPAAFVVGITLAAVNAWVLLVALLR